MMLANYLNIGLAVDLTGRDTLLNVLPLFHTAGINLYSSAIFMVGGEVLVVRTGIGMTKTGPTVFLLDEADGVEKTGSVGRPQLLTEVRIVNAGGEDLLPGEAGELLIRGPNVTPDYWNRPDATREAIDEDGCCYIVDRWQDMFISGVDNVYPAEVEKVLIEHPDIAEALVLFQH